MFKYEIIVSKPDKCKSPWGQIPTNTLTSNQSAPLAASAMTMWVSYQFY